MSVLKKVLVFNEYYLPGFKGGGPIKSLKNLFSEVGDLVEFKLVAADRDLGDVAPYSEVVLSSWNSLDNVSVFYMEPGLGGVWKAARIIVKDQYDVLYLNGFFSFRFSIAPLLVAKLASRKVILSPRGEFSKGAIALKRYKKEVFLSFVRLFNLSKGVVFQASSEREAADIRRSLGSQVDIMIAENVAARDFCSSFEPKAENMLRAVFVSRISPKKNLLGALQILRDCKHNITYDIYGPIEDVDYWSLCLKEMENLPSHIGVNYKGALHPRDILTTISSYDAFFLPTKGENYGHVIAEALCAGLPLVIADTTPWRNLSADGLGWDLSLDQPFTFSSALDELAGFSTQAHFEFRKGVLEWAKKRFSQTNAVEANMAMFRYAYEK